MHDSTAPIITLSGTDPYTVTVGQTYIDAGATAVDIVDGNLTSNITTGGTFVNTNAAGTFTITYDVSDAAGNKATQLTRTVIVTAVASSQAPTNTDATGSGGGCLTPVSNEQNIWVLPMFGLMFSGILLVRRKKND